MKLDLRIPAHGEVLEETLEGATWDQLADGVRHALEARLSFVKRMAARTLSDASFWAEVVRRYNDEHGTDHSAPATAEDFIDFGVEVGYATISR